MKTTGIAELLAWAFCNELCKVGAGGGGAIVDLGGGSAWSMVSEFAALGTLIDKSPNAFGVVPGFIEDGEPHGDALAVGDAVRKLAEIGFEVPDGWMPFPELDDPHGLISGEVIRVVGEERLKGDRLGGRHLVGLVTRAAILGHGPDWKCDQPTFRMVSANGKPRWFVMREETDSLKRVYQFETDGYNQRTGKPMKGAYRKWELSTPMRGDILARLDWQLWQDALFVLAQGLDGRLSEHRIKPFTPDRQPWVRVRKHAGQAQVIEKA